MEHNVRSSSSWPAQRQTCENICFPKCCSNQVFFAAGWQGWRNSSGSSVAIKAQDSDVCQFVPEIRRCRQDFWWGEKLEGPEKRGWHKVGFILCFLLTATFRLAQILLLNPADIRHASYGLAIMDMVYTTYSATIHSGTNFWTILLNCLQVCWTACVFTPHVFKY